MKKPALAFTLIELMIVVSIIGLLAAIAVPAFIKYQLRAKRAEGANNIAAIRVSEIVYEGSHDTYLSCAATPNPPASTVGAKVGWANGGFADFEALAWRPEGSVYFEYRVLDITTTQFTAECDADIDMVGLHSCYYYRKTDQSYQNAFLPTFPSCIDNPNVTDTVTLGCGDGDF